VLTSRAYGGLLRDVGAAERDAPGVGPPRSQHHAQGVVLPEPDGPSSVKNSPSATVKGRHLQLRTNVAVRLPDPRTDDVRDNYFGLLRRAYAHQPLEDVEGRVELLVADRERERGCGSTFPR